MMEPLSLYLHIPFCDHRCAYCDFNAYAGLEGLMPSYTDALVAEVEVWGRVLGRRAVPTVFFGGGTPSLLPAPLLARVIKAVRESFAVAPDAEWTLEANPGTVDQPYFRAIHTLGINRISLGVQSFNDEELRRLDRIHDAETAMAAYTAARAAGFENLSLDLIYGLEGQTLASWERHLNQAVALAPEHLSLYALTIEEGTPLAHRVARGSAPEPDPDVQADMHDLARARLAAAGYEHYEISNWAQPGRACRHNLVYWRDGNWLGLGAGAHSHIDGLRFAVMNSPAGYVRRLAGRAPSDADNKAVLPLSTGQLREAMPWVASVEPPHRALAMADTAIMALRLSEGLSLSGFAARYGIRFEQQYADEIAEMERLGLLECVGDRIRIPADRRLLANEVFARLMPGG